MDAEDLGGQTPPLDDDERKALVLDRRQMLKRAGLGAAALAVPSAVMATPAMGAVTDAVAADSFIKSHPKWNFVFVNHVTTNPFFVPTIYGAQDACSLLGTSYQWTGSKTSDISEMVNAFNAGIARKADGISVCLVSLTAFNSPTNKALGQGHPGAQLQRRCRRTTGWRTSARISTCRATAWVSGSSASSRAATSRSSSPHRASSTSSRASTASMAAIKKFGKGKIKTCVTATGALLPDELAKVEAYYLGHKGVKGMFAVDAGTTQAIGQVDEEVRPPEEGHQGGRLRPDPGDAPVDPTGASGLHDRPAALPTRLDPRTPALLLQVLVGARGAVEHEHRHPVRHEGRT